MNFLAIFKIIRMLTTKDSPEDSKRRWVFRRRFIGAGVLIGTGYLASRYGIILDGNASDILVNNLQMIIAAVSAFITTPWNLDHIGDKLQNLQALLVALGTIFGALKGAQGWIDRQKRIPVTVSPQGQVDSPSTQPAPPLNKIEPKKESGIRDSEKIENIKSGDG